MWRGGLAIMRRASTRMLTAGLNWCCRCSARRRRFLRLLIARLPSMLNRTDSLHDSDPDSSATALVVTGDSSNPTLVPEANIVFVAAGRIEPRPSPGAKSQRCGRYHHHSHRSWRSRRQHSFTLTVSTIRLRSSCGTARARASNWSASENCSGGSSGSAG